ncbi:MAG: glycosyltransferase family 39 protein, partial [Planctomycetota bacterium]
SCTRRCRNAGGCPDAIQIKLAVIDTFTLTEDEAHYWLWAKHLDWSYATKGPGIAALIAASTSILGDTQFAVRLPAALAAGITALAVASLARATIPLAGAGLLAATVMLALPGAQLTAVLMTIDGPYLACWAVAALAAWHAVARGSGPAWVAFGLAVGVGFLFKYTIVLLLPGVAIFAAWNRATLPRPNRAWLAAGLIAVLLGLVPIAVWNAQNDWATVRHLLGHLGLKGGDVTPSNDGRGYNPLWTLEYLGLTLAVGGATGILALQGLLNARREHTSVPVPPGIGIRFLACCAGPLLALYLAVTLLTNVEANWNVAAFVTLCPIAAWAVIEGRTRRDTGVNIAWRAAQGTLLLGLLAVPLLAVTKSQSRGVLGIPTNRAAGSRTLAAETQAKIDMLGTRTGLEPFVMTTHYGRASLLSFYLESHPTVFAAGHVHEGGRKTQFDLWPHADLRSDAVIAQLRGRPAVLFGGLQTDWTGVFDDIEPIGPLTSEPKATRTTWLGIGFRGFDRPAAPALGPASGQTPGPTAGSAPQTSTPDADQTP